MPRVPHRYRLSRAGVLNVWQYDEQVFHFADGRLLLRGTNGAGKSKTLELLLPFVLDGDKARMTATGRHGSQLLWLMSDGAASGGGTRTGYVWVEFARVDGDGRREVVTCGIGIRLSMSARQVTTWQFTVPTAVPELTEPDGTPLSAPRCRERVVELGGHSFDAPRAYKEHVGRLLFGLEPHAYDDLLRLLYWLRQPQVGEDLDPRRLVEMLDEALPALDQDAVRQVGEALDDLSEHGERVERMAAAADAVAASAALYARYAAGVLAERASAAREAERERAARSRAVAQQQAVLDAVVDELAAADKEQQRAVGAADEAQARLRVLEDGPLARSQHLLREKQRRAEDLAHAATRAAGDAERARTRQENSAARVEHGRAELARTGARLGDDVLEAQQAVQACALGGGLPPMLEPVALAEALEQAVPGAQRQVTAARAAVGVVRAALEAVERRSRARDVAAERAAEAERREEVAAGRLADAAREADEAARSWAQGAAAWAADQPALAVVVPEASAHAAAELAASAREAAAPVLLAHREQEAAAAAGRVSAEQQLAELVRRHDAIVAERDPAPPAPALPRPGRDAASGSPLWRLVDVRDGVPAASIEAALQASGLLDAQVLVDGAWRATDDTLLSVERVPGPTLADALSVDVPDDSPVRAEVVERVLRSVALLDAVCEPTGPPAVGRDGSWRLGPLSGRAGKPAAQYVGSAARQAERARQLAEVVSLQAVAEQERESARQREESAAAAQAALRAWLDALPPAEALRTALVRREERAAQRDRALAEATRAAEQLSAATDELGRAVAELERLCSQHDLPGEREALQVRADALGAVELRLQALLAEAARLLTMARRLEEDGESAERDAEEAQRAAYDAADAERVATQAAEEHRVLLDTLGADVQRMQRELSEAQRAAAAAVRDRRQAEAQVLVLTGRKGEAAGQLQVAEQRLVDVAPLLAQASRAVVALRDVDGLLGAALGRPLTDQERDGLQLLGAEVLPRPAVQLLTDWAAVAPAAPADVNAVYRDISTLAAGPAADQEPRVVPVGDELAVLARDHTGAEQPLAVVAQRLAAEVARERELLTDRERTLFEEHLLGELGDAVRSRRAEAEDLVHGMNGLLADVRTSQGIRVRLDWELREDASDDVRAAVDLLGKPRGSLAPEESARLHDAMTSLIELQRSADPEQGYAAHLARALDYRRWSMFAVKLQRPGVAGWTTLTRRTPLSQGEQKVVCYLPLFAAAAAHFTSVAGAAPHAPRLILLDDAFPKIDVRTHPLLFGLLVDLDLDFVLTSERLWGDHENVPSLAVYEALRAPGERGIAQYRYHWDGATLHGVG